jgi:hypothetical protein
VTVFNEQGLGRDRAFEYDQFRCVARYEEALQRARQLRREFVYSIHANVHLIDRVANPDLVEPSPHGQYPKVVLEESGDCPNRPIEPKPSSLHPSDTTSKPTPHYHVILVGPVGRRSEQPDCLATAEEAESHAHRIRRAMDPFMGIVKRLESSEPVPPPQVGYPYLLITRSGDCALMGTYVSVFPMPSGIAAPTSTPARHFHVLLLGHTGARMVEPACVPTSQDAEVFANRLVEQFRLVECVLLETEDDPTLLSPPRAGKPFTAISPSRDCQKAALARPAIPTLLR